MRVKEINIKGKTKHLYQGELDDMCKAKNVSESAKEVFKRKPYSVGRSEETKIETKIETKVI